jgi:hypothetical protein
LEPQKLELEQQWWSELKQLSEQLKLLEHDRQQLPQLDELKQLSDLQKLELEQQ